MSRSHLIVIALVVTVTTINGYVAFPAIPGSKNQDNSEAALWITDIRKAHQSAIKSGKPLIILFEASWCRYCRKLEMQTLDHPQVSDYVNRHFIPVKLDIDRDSRIAEILDVKSVPCTVILSPEADLLGKHAGYFKPGSYHAKLISAQKLQQRVRQVKYSTSQKK